MLRYIDRCLEAGLEFYSGTSKGLSMGEFDEWKFILFYLRYFRTFIIYFDVFRLDFDVFELLCNGRLRWKTWNFKDIFGSFVISFQEVMSRSIIKSKSTGVKLRYTEVSRTARS